MDNAKTPNDPFLQDFQTFKLQREQEARENAQTEGVKFKNRTAADNPSVIKQDATSLYSVIENASNNLDTLHGTMVGSDYETGILEKMGKSFWEEMSGSVSDFFMGNVAVEESILKTPTMNRKAVDDLYNKGKITQPMQSIFYSNYGKYRKEMPDEEAQLKAGEDLRGVIQGNKDRWQSGVDKFKRSDEYLKTEKSIPEEITGALGSSILPMAMTAVNPVLGFAINFNISKGNQYGELKNKIKADFPNLPEGDVIDRADIASSYSGGVVAGLETLSDMVKLRGVLKATGFKKWLLRAAESSFGEGLTEFAQQYPEEFATVWALNPDLSKQEILEFIGKDPEAFKRALHAGGIGAAVGGIMGGGVGGLQGYISNKQAKVNEERAAKAKEVNTVVDNLAANDAKVIKETEKLEELTNAEKQAAVDFNSPKTVADIPIAPERTRVKESVMASPNMSDDEKSYTVDLLDNLALASVKKGWAPDVETWYKNWYSSIEYENSKAKVQEVPAEAAPAAQPEVKPTESAAPQAEAQPKTEEAPKKASVGKIKPKKMYATSDGKKYDTKEDATDHQVWLDNQEKAKAVSDLEEKKSPELKQLTEEYKTKQKLFDDSIEINKKTLSKEDYKAWRKEQLTTLKELEKNVIELERKEGISTVPQQMEAKAKATAEKIKAKEAKAAAAVDIDTKITELEKREKELEDERELLVFGDGSTSDKLKGTKYEHLIDRFNKIYNTNVKIQELQIELMNLSKPKTEDQKTSIRNQIHELENSIGEDEKVFDDLDEPVLEEANKIFDEIEKLKNKSPKVLAQRTDEKIAYLKKELETKTDKKLIKRHTVNLEAYEKLKENGYQKPTLKGDTLQDKLNFIMDNVVFEAANLEGHSKDISFAFEQLDLAKKIIEGKKLSKTDLKQPFFNQMVRHFLNDPKYKEKLGPTEEQLATLKEKLIAFVDEKVVAHQILNQTVDKQQQGSAKNLFIDGAPKIITMLESHDVSTLVHESGHIMLAAMHANKDTDFATAATFVGADPKVSPVDWSTEQHEKVAKAWEIYLREGKTAIPALKNLFEKFKTFLTAVYKTVVGNDFKGPDGKQITLTPEIRQMFEGWLSAESRYNIDGLRDAAAKLGMSTKGMSDAQVENVYEQAKVERTNVKTAQQKIVEIAGMDDSELISEGEQTRLWSKELKNNLMQFFGLRQRPSTETITAIVGGKTTQLPTEGFTTSVRPLTNNKLFQTRTVDPEAEVVAMDKILAADIAADGIKSDKAFNINLRKLNTTDDVKKVISVIADSYRGKIDEQRRGVITEKQMTELANSLGLTYDQLAQTLPGTAANAETLLASRTLLAASAQRVAELATGVSDKAAMSLKSPAEILEFRKALRQHAAVQSYVSGLTAEAGRALRSFQIMRGSQDFMVSQFLDTIETQPMTENDVMKVAKDITDRVEKVGDEFKLKETNAAVQRSQTKKYGNMFISMFINNLISNPLTHIKNFASNVATGLETISENYIAAALDQTRKAKDKMMGKDTNLIQYLEFSPVNEQAIGWLEGWKDAFTAVAGAMPDLIKGEGVNTATRKFQTEDIVFKSPLARKTWEYFMTPSNLLELGDIVFTQGVNQRMNLYYHAKMESLNIAKQDGLNDIQTGELYSRMVADPAAYGIDVKVKEDSEYQTFRQRMGETGNRVAGVLNSLPVLRLIVPFMRTPTNITKFAMERTPVLNFLLSKSRADLLGTNGEMARSKAIAKLSIGSGATAVVFSLATQGLLTGGGPEDKDARRQWFEDGNQPYSVKIGDEWYSYKGLEPIASILGFAANTYEMYNDVDENGWKNITSTLVSVMAEQLTDATYFQGISDFVSVVREPERYSENWLAKMGTKMIPWSSASKYLRTNLDESRREFRDQSIGRGEDKPSFGTVLDRELDSLLKSVQDTIPGLSKNLPAKLNFWGESVPTNGTWANPFRSVKFKDDEVINTLLKDDISFAMPEKTANIMGVKVPLSPDEYNVYVELMNKYGGEETSGLRNAMKDIMDSASYQDTTMSKDDKRAMLSKEVNRAKSIARSQLYDSVPSVKQFVDDQLAKK